MLDMSPTLLVASSWALIILMLVIMIIGSLMVKSAISGPKLLVVYDNAEIAARAALRYAKDGDAGIDLYNVSAEPIILQANTSVEVPSGVRVKIPDGYVGLLRCRSSTFAKRGLFVVHNTIDSGFNGAMFVHVWHPGIKSDQPVIINQWERLAQLIIMPYASVDIIEVTKLPDTQRAGSGMGSTGV